jgi:hypothetical protein
MKKMPDDKQLGDAEALYGRQQATVRELAIEQFIRTVAGPAFSRDDLREEAKHIEAGTGIYARGSSPAQSASQAEGDTPRTDAMARRHMSLGPTSMDMETVLQFARQLEREANEAWNLFKIEREGYDKLKAENAMRQAGASK